MTIDQFRNHGWTPGQSCDYGGTIYKIASVDFAENLVGLANPLCDEEITWVRCENIILHNVKGHATPEHAPKIDQTASSASHVPPCSASSFVEGQAVIVEKGNPYPWRRKGIVKSIKNDRATVKIYGADGEPSMYVNFHGRSVVIGGSRLTLIEI